MNAFQWIAVPLMGLLFLLDVRRLLQRPGFRLDRFLRCLTWLAAGIAIYRPDLTTRAALAVGIQRGTDLVLYVFVLSFLGVAFHLYARTVRLERQLTDVVRHIAVSDARPPQRSAPGEPAAVGRGENLLPDPSLALGTGPQ